MELLEIRKSRLKRLGKDLRSSYAKHDYINQELEFCKDLYKKNRRWKVVSVTRKSIEEIASEIIERL